MFELLPKTVNNNLLSIRFFIVWRAVKPLVGILIWFFGFGKKWTFRVHQSLCCRSVLFVTLCLWTNRTLKFNRFESFWRKFLITTTKVCFGLGKILDFDLFPSGGVDILAVNFVSTIRNRQQALLMRKLYYKTTITREPDGFSPPSVVSSHLTHKKSPRVCRFKNIPPLLKVQ